MNSAVPMMAVWTGILSSTNLLVALATCFLFFLPWGVFRAARRAGFADPSAVAVKVAMGLGGWLAVTAFLAASGALVLSAGRPPFVLILPLAALATFVLVSRTQSFGRLMAVIPPWLPVALQSFRIVVELAFWRLHGEGLAPVQVTFEGRNFDILVGISAPVIALGIFVGRIGPKVTIAWNLLGVGILLNTIGTVFTSVPSPIHLDWPDAPFAALASWPVVWIPALFAPAAIFLHIASIRQSLVHLVQKGRAPTVD